MTPSGATLRAVAVGGAVVRDASSGGFRRAATATTRSGRAPTSRMLAFERFGQRGGSADRGPAADAPEATSIRRARFGRASPEQLEALEAPRPAAIVQPTAAPPAAPTRTGWTAAAAAEPAMLETAPSRGTGARDTGTSRDDRGHQAHAAARRRARQHRARRRVAVSPRAAREPAPRVLRSEGHARRRRSLQDAVAQVRRRHRARDPARTASAEHDAGGDGSWKRSTPTACSRSTTRSGWSSTSSASATAGDAAAPRRCRRRRPWPPSCPRRCRGPRRSSQRRARRSNRRPIPAAKEPVPLRVTAGRRRSLGVRPHRRPRTRNGQFSLARQLGLGVSRIVLDAGHGGHDPGARANGIERSGAGARRHAAAARAAREAAGHRSHADARHRRIHPARRADRDRQSRGAPTCSCRFTPTPAAMPRRAASRPTS